MEIAYSDDLNEIVDPEMAYDYFWAGIINDKKAFRCPNPECKAKVTCANIDKERQDMKQVPNFRGYNHIPDCYMINDSNLDTDIDDVYKNANIDIFSHDTFLLNRPIQDNEQNPEEYIERIRNGDSKEYTGSKYYSIRSLVSKWLRYRYEKKLEKSYIKISGEEISYKNFFKGIFNQAFENLPDTNLIYWGSAYIDRYETIPGYRIKFENHFTFKEENYNPSFIIRDKLLNEYQVKRLIEKRIEIIEKEHRNRCFVFVFGQPVIIRKDDREYINFIVENLDYIEIRYFDLIEELKNSKYV